MTKITLTCPHCRGDQFIQPENANLNSKVTCAGCKREFLASDLAAATGKKEAERLAAKALRATFGKMLK